LVVIVAIVIYARQVSDQLTRAGLSLVLGGALGNVVDRVLFGEVVDFFDVRFIQYPIFNTADVFIVTGVVILVLATWKESSNQKRRAESS